MKRIIRWAKELSVAHLVMFGGVTSLINLVGGIYFRHDFMLYFGAGCAFTTLMCCLLGISEEDW